MQLVDNETVRVRFSDSSVEYSSGGAQFLKQVSTLFESSSKSGSIWLTHKRRAGTPWSATTCMTYALAVLHEGADAHIKTEDDTDKEYPCLIRLTDGKETKFSTVVSTHILCPEHPQSTSILLLGPANRLGKVPHYIRIHLEVIHGNPAKTRQEAREAASGRRGSQETQIAGGYCC